MRIKKIIIISVFILLLCLNNVIIGNGNSIQQNNERFTYQNKSELFLAFYKDFYNYLLGSADGKLALEKSGIENLDDFYKAHMAWDDGIKGMAKAGENFGKLFLSSSMENDISTQIGKVGFIPYCVENDYYVDFINFMSVFFYYFRVGEGIVEKYGDKTGNYFYSPKDSAIDTAKFFYFNENTLPSYLTTRTELINFYKEIPLYKRKEVNNIETNDTTFIASVKKVVDLRENPDSYVFPTLLKQNYFIPEENDIFGTKNSAFPIYKVDIDATSKNYKKISLTFDSSDTATSEDVREILDILEQYGISATFFLEYNFIIKNQAIVSEILSKGHEIGNHSTNHYDFIDLTDENIINEILINHNLVKRLTGIDMCLFRFPYGAYNDRAINLVKKLGYYPIQWMLDSMDWKNEEPSVVLDRLINSGKVYSGSIVLFHVWPKNTKIVLPLFLDYVNKLGYDYAKVSDLIIKHDFIVPSGRQRKNVK